MKRGGIILALAMIAAVAAMAIACLMHHKNSSVEWLRTEFGLNAEQMKLAIALHEEYRSTCAEMCKRIAETDARLTAAIRTSDKPTPEIVAAIAETDRVRTECRVAMLRHFYKTSELMPSDKRVMYLEKVLPLVLHPGEMHAEHGQ